MHAGSVVAQEFFQEHAIVKETPWMCVVSVMVLELRLGHVIVRGMFWMPVVNAVEMVPAVRQRAQGRRRIIAQPF